MSLTVRIVALLLVAVAPATTLAGPADVAVFDDAEGSHVSVSVFGDASACERTPCVAVSGTGNAHALYALSAGGTASSCGDGFNCVAVSAAGPASGSKAVSVAGDATSTCEGEPTCLAVSGAGNANGWSTVDADGVDLGGWYGAGAQAPSDHDILAECHSPGIRILQSDTCSRSFHYPGSPDGYWWFSASSCRDSREFESCSYFTGELEWSVRSTHHDGQSTESRYVCRFSLGAYMGCERTSGPGVIYVPSTVDLRVRALHDPVAVWTGNNPAPSYATSYIGNPAASWHFWISIPQA